MKARGWMSVLWLVLALVLLVAFATALLWVVVIVVALGAVVAFRFIFLPRWLATLHLSGLAIDLLVLAVLITLGAIVGRGRPGAIGGVVVWLLGVGAPRLALMYYGQRLLGLTRSWPEAIGVRGAAPMHGEPVEPIHGVTCSQCGLVTFLEPGAGDRRCPRCDALLPAADEVARQAT